MPTAMPAEAERKAREAVTRPIMPAAIERPVSVIRPVTREITEMPAAFSATMLPTMPMPTVSEERIKEPIFVKIDNFKSSLANFENIKKKLKEIEALLQKIRKTRTEEEAELSAWEEEIKNIRERVADIDKRLFNRI